jgi:hypothetical protein
LDEIDGIPALILDTSYNSIDLKIGKYYVEATSDAYTILYKFNGESYYTLGKSKAFFKILQKDNELYLNLIDMTNVLCWGSKNSCFSKLLDSYDEEDLACKSNRIEEVLKSCYLSLCQTRNFYSYKRHIIPHLDFLKKELNKNTEGYKWLDYLERLNLKFIVDALGK